MLGHAAIALLLAVPLRGQVLSKGTRQPLGGAAITVDAVPAGEADDSGRFLLEVESGPRRVQVQHPGFEPLDLKVEAGGEEQIFRLAPRQTGERYETVVTPPDERAARTTLREEELTRVPGSMGDPFRVIESLPGVSQVLWPLALYTIRGANPGNTGFFLDGVRMPTLFHFALGPSVIHPFFLQEINFYPGGYPVRYGRYVSGIVAAKTAAPQVDRPHASLDVRLFDAGGIVAAPFNEGRGNIAVAGRYSYTGLLVSALQENYELGYWDYQVRAEHTMGPGRLTVFAFGSGDHLGRRVLLLSQTDDGVTDELQHIRLQFHRVDVRWDGRVLGGRAEVGMLASRDESSTSITEIASRPIAMRSVTAAPRLSYGRALASWADLELGGDAEFQRYWPTSEIAPEMRQDLFQNRDVQALGGYLGFTFRAGSRLSLSPGIRTDVFLEQQAWAIEDSPRLTVRFRPAGDVWLKASAGRFAQMASLPVAVPGFEGFGLDDYGTQTSLQGSFGVEAPLARTLSLDATAFYQRLHLTDLASLFLTDATTGPLVEVRDGRSYGLEVMLRRPLGQRLYGWLAYTLSKSERAIGYFRQRVPSDWDQRHIVNLVLGYRLRRGYTLGSRIHYNTGRLYPVFDLRTSLVDYRRLDPFFQLDLRVDKRFVFDRFVLDAYVELVNSTLSREVYDLKQEVNGTLNSRGYRIALPSVGVHAEW